LSRLVLLRTRWFVREKAHLEQRGQRDPGSQPEHRGSSAVAAVGFPTAFRPTDPKPKGWQNATQTDARQGRGSLNQFVMGGDSNTPVVSGIRGINAVAVNDRYIFVADGQLLRRVARP